MVVAHDSIADIFRGQLFLFAGTTPIAFATSASLDISTEEVDVSNKMIAGGWKFPLPGQKSFTSSSESLITRKEGACSFDALLAKQIAGETLEFFLGETIVTDQTATGGTFALDKSKPFYEGNMMITSLSLTSENNNIATCSASFVGVGALTPGTIVPLPAEQDPV